MSTATERRFITPSGKWIQFRSQEQVQWRHAKRLMRLSNGSAGPDDLEFALAIMIEAWQFRSDVPTVNKDGTVNPNGLDDLTAAEINEIASLLAEANQAVGK